MSLDQKPEEKRISSGEFEHSSAEKAVIEPIVDQNERNRILRKLDWHLLPFVSLLYLLSFLDRSNIGNARIAGMAKDLDLVGLKYNIAAAVFFILYALSEVPSNIALKLLRPSLWIPSIMVAWGLVMTLMSLVNSFAGLIIARIFLGLTEAGLFPGITFYISLWYPRNEQSKRVAIFFSAATIAGAFGGLLAYGIERLESKGNLHGWQWIFLLEGIVTVLVALASYFYMHDYPSTAKFLTEKERNYVVNMLKKDSSSLASHYRSIFVWQAFLDFKTYLHVLLYMGILIPVYAISLFLPTIIQQLGYSDANAQLLTVPPFVAGCACTIAVGIASDKLRLRGPFIIGSASVAIIGYIILYVTVTPGAGYAGTVIAAVGVFPSIAVSLAWAGGNAGGDIKRGVVIAMVIGIGNLGGICSSFIYFRPPRFHEGHGTILGCLSLSIVMSGILTLVYRRQNAKKEEQCLMEGIKDTTEYCEKYKELGDASPLFRYTL